MILSFKDGLNFQTPVLVNLVCLFFIYEEKYFSVLMIYSILKGAPIVFSKYFVLPLHFVIKLIII